MESNQRIDDETREVLKLIPRRLHSMALEFINLRERPPT